MSVARRMGFTLLELLVVIAIIGILASLFLVGVQSTVASSRSAACQSNLRQIGTAIRAYHTAVGCYPITITDRNLLDSGGCGTGFYSWRAYLLPYLEQNAVYDQVNFDVAMSDDCSVVPAFSESHPNATAARNVIEVYLCPADGYRPETTLSGAAPANDNYAANFGWPPQSTGIESTRAKTKINPFNGVLGLASGNPSNPVAWHPRRAVTDRDVLDGLQNTALVAERLIFHPKTFDDPRRLIYCGGSPGARTQERLAKYCSLVDVPDKVYSSMIGQAWISGYAPFGPGYMHLMTPNRRNCHDAGGELTGNWWTTASSNHSGGVNVVMADGHVEWVADAVDARIWWSMGSRDGEEVFRQ